MLNSIDGGEVEQSIRHGHFHHHRIDLAAGSVSKQHRSGLGAQHQHVLRAIVFLVAACALVFPN